MSGLSRTCPCDGCAVEIPAGVLMCRPHWLRVPRDQREEVRVWWRKYQEAAMGRPRRDAFQRYLLARNNAIRAVNAKRAADRQETA